MEILKNKENKNLREVRFIAEEITAKRTCFLCVITMFVAEMKKEAKIWVPDF